ncbi:MAG TPA: hypothetical protein VJ997_04480 [Longimicrobiales bacterium]|nr:hypothetical protein [Longimicrobiales bacterium]
MPSDRRTFLGRAAALSLLGPTLTAWACGGREAEGESEGEGGDPDGAAPPVRLVTRPALVPLDAGTVHILAPTAELPVAYLSRGEMRLYLDPAYRDWAEHRLAAYVSVTTGLWRIGRPEDDPAVPIIPGDALREFEVVDIRWWDPAILPVEGDARLRLGTPVPVRIELDCVPVMGGETRVSADPVSLRRRDGPAGRGGREDLVAVGVGTRHDDRTCDAAGDAVRLVTWAEPSKDG